MDISIQNCRVDHLSSLYQFAPVVDVLRLDLIHPVISGNKWFKLKEYLTEAKQSGKKTLVTFGGAYSNHIVATAAAARANGFNSIGIIRGERPVSASHTLANAIGYGMRLYFVSREDYKKKIIPDGLDHDPDGLYFIPEGGCGEKGMRGAAGILRLADLPAYTHIVSAVGTGTTLAGLTSATSLNQKVIGISVLKNNFSLQAEVENLLPADKHKSFQLLQDYHFGGYAKHTRELLEFMNEVYSQTSIPTDFVYTGKAFYAVFDLVRRGYFRKEDAVLLIHTGGLQGNYSLPKGTLIFG